MKAAMAGARVGRARVGGAVTIINATATGIGCAVGVEEGLEATWRWSDHGTGLDWQGPGDPHVAQAVLRALGAGMSARKAVAVTDAPWPPARGLKTSSQAAAALWLAAQDATEVEGKRPARSMEPHLVAAQAARICLDAGVSITGAFDDAMAVIAGGIHMTDNASCHVLHRHIQVPPWVAVWIPDAPISKQQVRPIDVGAARPGARKAQQALLRGELGLAMRHNHAAYFPVYKDAGLPVADEPVLAALDAGAIGATISGTGPAVGALFDARTRLDDVEGGTWRWCRTREAH